MENSASREYAAAIETFDRLGYVDLPTLRDLSLKCTTNRSFSDLLLHYVLAFNTSLSAKKAIRMAAENGSQAALSVQQMLLDAGAWKDPFVQIDGTDFTRLREQIAVSSGFDPQRSSAEYYPYYEPGTTIGYRLEWIREVMNEATDRFSDFCNDRTSDTAILIGNGPSLNKVDFSLLEGRDVFISNYAIKHNHLRAVAKGVAVTNYLIAEQEPHLFSHESQIWSFFPFWLRHHLYPGNKTVFLNAEGGELFFSENVCRRVGWHSTVTFFWLQILYSAGYDRVLMTGFDNSYKQGTNAKEGDVLLQKDDDPNHFDAEYFRGKKWQAADTGKMEDTYVLAKRHYEKAGRELVNCTVGGSLETLKRSSLEDELVTARQRSEKNTNLKIALVTAFWKGDADIAETHFRSSKKFIPPDIDHIHVFKHSRTELPCVTMPNVICADLDSRYPDAVGKPHPAGPNLSFVFTAKLTESLGYSHFFWFEPDCVPTQMGWLDPFLAAAKEFPEETIFGTGGGTVTPEKPYWKHHFAGCSLYNVKKLNELELERLIENDISVSFDIWLSRELGFIELGDVNNEDQSNTIIFGEDRYNWLLKRRPPSTIVGMFEHWRPEKLFTREQLKKRIGSQEFKLFHSVKDQDLLILPSKNKQSKAAIIIINYNNEEYIREAIDTALECKKKYADLKIVVVDDGSSDRSRSIIDSFGSQIASIFLDHGLCVPNFNQQRALKAGLSAIDADIVFLMDGDDRFNPEKVANVMPYFEDPSVVLVQHRLRLIDQSGAPTGGEAAFFPQEEITVQTYEKEGRVNLFQPTSGLIFRRTYLEKSLTWLVPDEHIDTWLDVRTSRIAPLYGRVVSTPSVLGDWRRHSRSDSIRTDNVKERVAKHHFWFAQEALKHGFKWVAEGSGMFFSSNQPCPIEFTRDQRAGVDETSVVAHLLKARSGRSHTMVDVGAHIGSSAQYFHELGWSIYCFEPDPDNRAKLISRFGSAQNIEIDARAVSDEPATKVQFFKSDQSSGISGLHAFHNSHTDAGFVDITTVREVIRNRDLKNIDFLKIDVEGFDFNVLKGVPWDQITPDVIECEFEDAKTLKLGHDWKKIANFLTSHGYAVYVSEWHPIVRYGISHDWRRVFRYGEAELEPDAWGNLLAFKVDPGLDRLLEAFQAKTKYRSTTASNVPGDGSRKQPSMSSQMATSTKNERNVHDFSTLKKTPGQNGNLDKSISKMLQKTPGRQTPKIKNAAAPVSSFPPDSPWYAKSAHRLKALSPGAFHLLRFLRRSLLHVYSRPYLLFGLTVVLGLIVWIGIDASMQSAQPLLFTATLSGLFLTLLVYVAYRAHFHAEQLHRRTDLFAAKMDLFEKSIGAVDGKIATAQATAAKLKQGAIEFTKQSLDENVRPELDSLSQLVAETRQTSDANNNELITFQAALDKLVELVSELRSRVTQDATKVSMLKVEQEQSEKQILESIDQQRIETTAALNDVLSKVQELSGQVQNQFDEIASFRTGLDSQSEMLAKQAEVIDAQTHEISTTKKWSAIDNTKWFQHFNRLLDAEHVEVFIREWGRKLSLPINKQVLGYMASRACGIERQLDGRLATSIEDILLRTLASKSVKSKNLNVLEIGTLFGTGAAIIHDAASGLYESIHMTLLDPLEGYYNAMQSDVLTGQAVNEETLRRNLSRVGIQDTEYTLIKHLSTDADAIKAAGKREYDVLIIDGDHSYAGVKTDFENYARFVKLGGYIVFDDYASPDWPDVQRYVDDEMPKHEFVTRVGASWRTCIYRVVTPPSRPARSRRRTTGKQKAPPRGSSKQED